MELTGRLLDDEITDAEATELERLVAADAEAAQTFDSLAPNVFWHQ
jgi:hypothetical protein